MHEVSVTRRVMDMAVACGAVPLVEIGGAGFTQSQLIEFYQLAVLAGRSGGPIGPLPQDPRVLDPRVGELALLVRRLAQLLNIRSPGHPAVTMAQTYLLSNGLPASLGSAVESAAGLSQNEARAAA